MNVTGELLIEESRTKTKRLVGAELIEMGERQRRGELTILMVERGATNAEWICTYIESERKADDEGKSQQC